jgi:hypothetical protein
LDCEARLDINFYQLAFAASSQLPRSKQLMPFDAVSYGWGVGRLPRTEGVSGLQPTPALWASRSCRRVYIARDPQFPLIPHSRWAHRVPNAPSPRRGGECTATAAGARPLGYLRTRARRVGGAGCPLSGSNLISLPCTMHDCEPHG